MPGAQARACLPAVLEFAELEEWADAPMRVYSEGMKLRLAFGVLAQFEPEVLLLDEVLSVGDVAFERKCLDHVSRLTAGGTALLLASHNLDQVMSHCRRALWLHDGAVWADGDAHEVVSTYREQMMHRTIALTPASSDGAVRELELGRNRFGSQEARVDRVLVLGPHGTPVSSLEVGDPLTVHLTLDAPSGGMSVSASVSVIRLTDGVKCCDATTSGDGLGLNDVEGRMELALSYDQLDLEPGEYAIEVGLWAPDWRYAYDLHQRAYPLRIVGQRQGEGLMRTRHRWETSAASTSLEFGLGSPASTA